MMAQVAATVATGAAERGRRHRDPRPPGTPRGIVLAAVTHAGQRR
jgi:hypothetical protein